MALSNQSRRLSTLAKQLNPHPVAADKPDIGAPRETYAYDRMSEEAMAHVIGTMRPEGACRPFFPDPVEEWGTVTRGDPPGHLLPPDQLPAAGLTEATWFLDVDADPAVDPPHVRSPASITKPLELNLAMLKDLGSKYGTVKVMKAMQCLNVDSPLGQGVWEGVPLSTVLRQCGKIANCRRIYYWGFHNNDDRQVFRSSISYTEAFENVPGEPPVFLAYKLNGKPLPLVRGGPVRMIVPFAHGFKNVKFLQHIRLTNDYRANDTYAAIDEGEEGNDPASVQKTYTTVDHMRGAPAVPKGEAVRLSGVLMNGRTPASHLEYWVRGPNQDFRKPSPQLEDDDAELLAGPWIRFEVPSPPENFDEALPEGIRDIFGTDENGTPIKFPLPFSYTSWIVSITGLSPGFYEIRARAVDEAGNAQPEPRPYHKAGRNSIHVRRLQVLEEELFTSIW